MLLPRLIVAKARIKDPCAVMVRKQRFKEESSKGISIALTFLFSNILKDNNIMHIPALTGKNKLSYLMS